MKRFSLIFVSFALLIIICLGVTVTKRGPAEPNTGIRVVGAAFERRAPSGGRSPLLEGHGAQVRALEEKASSPDNARLTDERILSGTHESALILQDFKRQPADQDWSQKTGTNINRVLQKVPYLSLSQSYYSDCRMTLCVVGVSPVEKLSLHNKSIYVDRLQSDAFLISLNEIGLSPKITVFLSNGGIERIVFVVERNNP